MIVGQVHRRESRGRRRQPRARASSPTRSSTIPSNVTAAILPKTLFGEKYVELDIPADPSSASLRAGDRITQTKLPIEVEKVLNDLYPLLRTVQPGGAELHPERPGRRARGPRRQDRREPRRPSTATSSGSTPRCPALIDDIKLLATVTDTYADVVPDARRDPAQHRQDRQHAWSPRRQKLNAVPQGHHGVLQHHQAVPGRQRRQHHPAGQGQRADPGPAGALLRRVPVPARGPRPAGAAAGRAPSADSSSTSTSRRCRTSRAATPPRTAGLRRRQRPRPAAACPTRRCPYPSLPQPRRRCQRSRQG